MTTMTLPPRVAVEISSAGDICDAEAAEALLRAQHRWLTALGIPAGDGQVGAGSEYANPTDYYAGPRGALFVARVGNRPVGLVGLRPLDDHSGRVELRRMFLLPASRNAGVGRALLTAAIERAESLGYTEVVLETMPVEMAAAHRFYLAAGFRESGSYGRPRYPGVVTMSRSLAGSGFRVAS